MATSWDGGMPRAGAKPRPVQERFNTAVEVIKSLPKDGPYQPSNAVKLRFYALYKQSMEGPCTLSRPSFWDVVGRAKWEAWMVCGNMRKELAMQMYVEELQQLVETMPQTKQVEEFLKSIGPFYEIADEDENEQPRTPANSPSEVGAVSASPSEPSSSLTSGSSSGDQGTVRQLEGPANLKSSLISPDELANGIPDNWENPLRESPEVKGQEESEEESDSGEFQDSFQYLELTSSGVTPLTTGSGFPSYPLPLPHNNRDTQPSTLHERRTLSSIPGVPTFFGAPTSGSTVSGPSGESGRFQRGTTSVVPSENLPVAIAAVTSQLQQLQQSVQSLLQQLNSVAEAVQRVTQLTQQRPVRHHHTKLQHWCRRVAPFVIARILLISTIMAFVSTRISGGQTRRPPWIWAIFALFNLLWSFLSYYFS